MTGFDRSGLRRLGVAVAIVVLAACGEKLSREELLARAGQALADRDYSAAVIDVKTALQDAPNDAEGRALYGRILLQQRALPEAAEQFRRSLDAGFAPDVAELYAYSLVSAGDSETLMDLAGEGFFSEVRENPRYLAARAIAEAVTGDFFTASATLDEADAIDADNQEVRRSRALILAQQGGDLESAVEILDGLLEDYPDYADAWTLRATILRAQGDIDGAIDAYARAGELNMYRVPDRLNQLSLLVAQNRLEEVEELAGELDRQLPENPGVNYAQARLAIADGDSDRAMQELDAVLKSYPQHAPTLFFAANENLKRGNLSTAEAQIESFLAIRPRDANARLMLAEIYKQRGAVDNALALTTEVLDQQPENETARLLNARLLAADGQYERSAVAFADIVALQSESPQLRAEYGAVLLRAGDAERGAREMEAAIRLAPDNMQLRTGLVQAQLQAGNAQGAREAVEAFNEAFPGTAEGELLRAQVAVSEGDTDAAREYLNAALEIDPDNPGAQRGLSGLALSEDDPDAAADVLRANLDADKPDLQNLIRLAAIEERRGDMEAMEQVLRRAVDAYPQELAPRLLLARYAYQTKRPGEALDLLTAVRERYADNPALQRLLVGVFLTLEQPGAAVNAARKLVELAPGSPAALRLAAQAERLDENLPEAEELLREVVRLAPDDLQARKLLIETLFLQADLPGVSEELALLPASFAEPELIDFARGRIALSLDDPEAAERLLRRAHQRQPNSLSLFYLSSALIRTRKVDEALRLLDDWVAEYPEDGLALTQLGSLRAVRGEDALAVKAYEVLVEKYPDDLASVNNLAWSLRETDTPRALTLVNRALEKVPDSPAILDTKAVVLMHAGEYDEALATLDRVVEIAGTNLPLAFHRAEVLARAGRSDEARSILEILAAGPAFPEQKQAIALLESL